MSYEERYKKMCFDDEVNIRFSYKTCRLVQQADKEIKELKACQALTEMNFTDYSEDASKWLADSRKELEAKDNEITHFQKQCLANKKEIAELKQSMLLCSGPCHFPDSEEKLNQIKAEAVKEVLKDEAVILWISRAEQEEQILNVINNYATKLLTKEDRE